MMATIDKSDLVKIIDRCAALSPLIIRGSMELISGQFAADSNCVAEDVAATDFLRCIIDRYRFMLVPDVVALLDSTPIVVPPLPICNAIADLSERRIVIFEGLLDAIAYKLEASLLINAILRALPRLITDRKLSEGAFKQDAFRILLMPIHFMLARNPLPRFTNRLSPELQQDAFGGFGGMLLFILFHELGHLVLNHGVIGGVPVLEILPALVRPEALNLFKQYEFAADQYAYDALVPKARSVFIASMLFAIQIFSEFESLSGITGSTHPLSINRISRFSTYPGVLSDSVIASCVRKTLDATTSQIDIQVAGRHPHESFLGATMIASLREDALVKVLDGESLCRESVNRLLDIYDLVRQQDVNESI